MAPETAVRARLVPQDVLCSEDDLIVHKVPCSHFVTRRPYHPQTSTHHWSVDSSRRLLGRLGDAVVADDDAVDFADGSVGDAAATSQAS